MMSEVFSTNLSPSSTSEVAKEYEAHDLQPEKNVYYFCGGLDVSAGGIIDCGTGVRDYGDAQHEGDVGATEANEFGHATPNSTLR